jgi:hypothetical protein
VSFLIEKQAVTKGGNMMKHVAVVSRTLPAQAIDHPSFENSVKGFLEDPVGVIELHLNKDE